MKKIIAILYSVLLIFTVAIPSVAQGSDDGTITVATKDDVRYLGTEITSGCTKYVAANGSDSCFYDMNADKNMDICDLVALRNGQVDFDLNGTYNALDDAAFRIVLLDSMNS